MKREIIYGHKVYTFEVGEMVPPGKWKGWYATSAFNYEDLKITLVNYPKNPVGLGFQAKFNPIYKLYLINPSGDMNLDAQLLPAYIDGKEVCP